MPNQPDEHTQDDGELDLTGVDRDDPELRDLINTYEALRTLLPELERRLTEEHRTGPPPRAQLERQLERSSDELARLDAELESRKGEARDAQRGADEWLRAYEQLPELERGPGWEKVEVELRRRGAALQVKQEKIAGREQDRLKLLAEVSLAKERLMAAQAGVYGKGLDKDPRLGSAKDALRQAKDALRQALKRRRA
jgi:hypothetical protein